MSVAVRIETLPRRPLGAIARDYIALTKPRVVVLLEVTAVAAMIMAARGLPHLYLGYYVAGCPSLHYKANFTPNQILGPDGHWRDFRE